MHTTEEPKTVIATTFADPADIRRFRAAKAAGKTDREAFRVGDNGIGCWGDDTTAPRPMVALPPEDWKRYGDKARGKPVLVYRGGTTVRAELRDTMPSRKNIHNGAGIDLNPTAAEMLRIPVPGRAVVAWRWAGEPDRKPKSTLKILVELIGSYFRPGKAKILRARARSAVTPDAGASLSPRRDSRG